MAKRKKPTIKQIKRAAAKKAGRTKHELSELNRRIATQKLLDDGMSVMEIAVNQRRRLSAVMSDLRMNEKNKNSWHHSSHITIPSAGALQATISTFLKEHSIDLPKDIGEALSEGIREIFVRGAQIQQPPRLPPTLRGRGGLRRE